MGIAEGKQCIVIIFAENMRHIGCIADNFHRSYQLLKLYGLCVVRQGAGQNIPAESKKQGANDSQAENETHEPYKNAIHRVLSLAARKIALHFGFYLIIISFLRDNPCVLYPFNRGAEAQAGLCEDHGNDRIKRGGGVGGEGVALIAISIFNICASHPAR